MDQDGDQLGSFTELKLLKALQEFRRLNLHQHSIAGCKPSEIRILLCIQEGSKHDIATMKVSEISKRLNVTSPTVTQLLKGLEAHGLIERHMDVLDRRAVGVKLTEQGEMVARKAEDGFKSMLHKLITYLGEDQSNQLADLLFTVFRYFSESEAAMSHSQWSGDQDA